MKILIKNIFKKKGKGKTVTERYKKVALTEPEKKQLEKEFINVLNKFGLYGETVRVR